MVHNPLRQSIYWRVVGCACPSAMPACSDATRCSVGRWIWLRRFAAVHRTAASTRLSEKEDATSACTLLNACLRTTMLAHRCNCHEDGWNQLGYFVQAITS